ncbi:MAG: hypothetical protein JXQ99_05115 [Hyphomicrobiaceae bacterium]
MTITRKTLIATTAILMTATIASAHTPTTYVPPGPCPHNPEWVKAAFWTSPVSVPCYPHYRD